MAKQYLNNLSMLGKNLYISSAETRASMSLLHIITIIFKHKWIIISFFCVIVSVVTLGSVRKTDIFRAGAKFMVEREVDREKALLFQVNVPSYYEKYDWITSEVEIIKSYPVALRVVKALQLHKRLAESSDNSSADSDLEIESSIKTFRNNTQIDVAKNSNVIEISYEDANPVVATQVVKSIIEHYAAYRSELYDESETYNFFEEQMRITDNKLRELEHHQSEFKKNSEMISLETQKNILLERLTDFEKRLTEVQTKRRRKAATLNVMKDQLARAEIAKMPAIESSDNPAHWAHVIKLRDELVELELQREIVLQKFTPEYQEAINLERQITVTREKINSEMIRIVEMEDFNILSFAAEENMLRQSIVNTCNEIRDLAQKEYEYSQISRGIEDNREIYSMLLKQREEARISLAKLQKGIRVKIISPAVVPIDPINPRTHLKIAVAIILGLVCGLGFAFLWEYFDHTFTFPDEVELYTGLVVLGSVRELKYIPSNVQTVPKKLDSKKYEMDIVRDEIIT